MKYRSVVYRGVTQELSDENNVPAHRCQGLLIPKNVAKENIVICARKWQIV